ncbi:uncharacterized protein DS421_12g364180 [Arachis hypogaea]|nr:uncharacterized protein DS421_12g364180 [Arachis hypogaea]
MMHAYPTGRELMCWLNFQNLTHPLANPDMVSLLHIPRRNTLRECALPLFLKVSPGRINRERERERENALPPSLVRPCHIKQQRVSSYTKESAFSSCNKRECGWDKTTISTSHHN